MTPSRIVPAFLLALLAVSCAHGPGSGAGSKTTRSEGDRRIASSDPVYSELAGRIAEFQILVEEALVWRAKAIEAREELLGAAVASHLDHSQLERIHRSAKEYVALHDRLIAIAHASGWMADAKTRVAFAPGEGTGLWQDPGNLARRLLHRPITRLRLDPSDPEGRRMFAELKMSLGAALVLYDNYLMGIYPYERNRKIHYLVDLDSRETKGQLRRISKSYVDREQRAKLARAIRLRLQEVDWKARAAGQEPSPEEKYLDLLIDSSVTYHSVVDPASPGEKGPDLTEAELTEAEIAKLLRLTKRTFTFYTSRFFGNTMGLVATRKGYLKALPAAEKEAMADTLQPLDILLEKTPFRLTDQFIPGHWGHVAIWVGSEEQLRALGIWDDKLVVPHHEKIRRGGRIVEALRPGVQLNTLEHFLNIDDLLALRHPTLTPAQTREYLLRTFEQIGKEYDFNFDVETDKRIVCSELAYVVYHNIKWPTEETLNRSTISPDHVAIKGVNGPLVPVLIYHDGRKVPENVQGGYVEILDLLLNLRYPEVKARMQAAEELARDAAPASRTLASEGVAKILESIDLGLYGDYFQAPTYQKQVRTIVHSKFWTDMSQEYLKTRAREALDQAISKTLTSTEGGKSLTERLKGHLLAEFLDNFVYTLYLYKIVNGTLQFDLHFLPELDDPKSLDAELASNRLVRLSDTGKLSGKLQALDQWSVTGQLKDLAPRLSWLQGQAGSGSEALAAGGVISIHLKLLDLNFNPRQPIPNTKKNAVKGFVRYRRYFARPAESARSPVIGSFCSTDRVRLERSRWEGGASTKQFFTVDYYKSFNVAGFVPQPDTLEIFPGRLVASNKGRTGLLPRGTEFVGKTVKTGEWNLEGEYKGAAAARFTHDIESLVYRFDKKRFDASLSAIKPSVQLKEWVGPESTGPGHDPARDSIAAVLEECPDVLSALLGLDRYSRKLEFAKGRN